jgi:hypothetical protein
MLHEDDKELQGEFKEFQLTAEELVAGVISVQAYPHLHTEEGGVAIYEALQKEWSEIWHYSATDVNRAMESAYERLRWYLCELDGDSITVELSEAQTFAIRGAIRTNEVRLEEGNYVKDIKKETDVLGTDVTIETISEAEGSLEEKLE